MKLIKRNFFMENIVYLCLSYDKAKKDFINTYIRMTNARFDKILELVKDIICNQDTN